LVGDCDEEGDGEIVIVENVNSHIDVTDNVERKLVIVL